MTTGEHWQQVSVEDALIDSGIDGLARSEEPEIGSSVVPHRPPYHALDVSEQLPEEADLPESKTPDQCYRYVGASHRRRRCV